MMKKKSRTRQSKQQTPAGMLVTHQPIKLAELEPLPLVHPPIWTDRMEMTVRSDIPVATLRFVAAIFPNHALEVSRLQTTVQHVKQMADLICRTLDYYPAKLDTATSPTPSNS